AGDVWSSNYNDSTVTEYGPGASGDAAPIRTLAGAATGLDRNDDISLMPDGTLYVGNLQSSTGYGTVLVFAPGASGDVAPEAVVTGPATGLGTVVDGVGVDATGMLYADNSVTGTIEVFAPGASGNVAPLRTISGLALPDD